MEYCVTFLTFRISSSSLSLFSSLAFSNNQRYSWRILNLNSTGFEGSYSYEGVSGDCWDSSRGFMKGCLKIMYSLLEMLRASYWSPCLVMTSLSHLRMSRTSKSSELCHLTYSRFLWAFSKLGSTLTEVTKQMLQLEGKCWERQWQTSLVLPSVMNSESTILILPSASLQLNKDFKAFSLIFSFKWKEQTLGFGPWILAPLYLPGALKLPNLALPCPFWGLGFFPDPEISETVRVLCVLNLFRLILHWYSLQIRSLLMG